MRCLLAISLLSLSACSSSSPDMLGARRHELRVEGIGFVVFAREFEAEVIRMGYLPRARRGDVPALMAKAATEATGCAVIPNSMTTRIPGDTGVARFDLDCAAAR